MKLRTIQHGVQQQVLAQVLRQSLEILQMPVLELKALLEREFESNPVLEEVTREGQEHVQWKASGSSTSSVTVEEGAGDDLGWVVHPSHDPGEEWQALGLSEDEEEDPLAGIAQPPPSLADVLLQQVHSQEFTPEIAQAAEVIVGSLDDAGYLPDSLEEIGRLTQMPVSTLEAGLAIVQGCKPAGVGARSLQECLLIQLRVQDLEDSLAARLVSQGALEQLAKRDYARLARHFGVTPQEIEAAAQQISSLAPRPGELVPSQESAPAVVPDLVITKKGNGKFHILLRNDELPLVRISPRYRRMLNDPKLSEEVRAYVRERIQAAVSVLRGIHQRQQTMSRLGEAIVSLQPEFLEHGLSVLRPMTHKQMAEAISRHPSTVARAVSRKYLECPAGVFALADLFSQSVEAAGGNVSSQSVRMLLKELVAAEDRRNPLSDEELVQKLQAQGIQVARRTVAKYRQQLKIPPTHQRRLAHL